MTNEAAGASSISVAQSKANTRNIEAAFTEWVVAALGFTRSSSITLTLTDVSHQVVTDAHAIDENTPLLWEVVKVSAFSLVVGESESVSLSADLVGDQITEHLGGKVKFVVSELGTRTFSVRADRPVVAAIRVIDPGYRLNTESGTQPMDLSDAAVGRQQFVQFGYVLILQGPVDYPSRTATLRIDNAAARQFTGVTLEFQENEPWVSPKRTAIQGLDPELRDAQFVWDKIALIWSSRLAESGASVVRQYMTPQPMRSGLEGVR